VALAAPRLSPVHTHFYHFCTSSEYYFSEENLQKDMFLRRNMDSQGWVDLGLVANFKRVRAWSTDVSDVIEAVRPSTVVQLNFCYNGPQLSSVQLRSADQWPQWVVTADDQLPG
jgi:la-related protein 1